MTGTNDGAVIVVNTSPQNPNAALLAVSEGVFAGTADTSAALIVGDVDVTGTLSASAKFFVIDHPLDPANKYLVHASVESSEQANIYSDNVVLDDHGEAVVHVPAWVEALSEDFRYQLTCVGGSAPVYIAAELAGNQFRIAGGTAGLKVSWQLTGIRKDAWAKPGRNFGLRLIHWWSNKTSRRRRRGTLGILSCSEATGNTTSCTGAPPSLANCCSKAAIAEYAPRRHGRATPVAGRRPWPPRRIAGAGPDRTQAIPCTVRAVTGQFSGGTDSRRAVPELNSNHDSNSSNQRQATAIGGTAARSRGASRLRIADGPKNRRSESHQA